MIPRIPSPPPDELRTEPVSAAARVAPHAREASAQGRERSAGASSAPASRPRPMVEPMDDVRLSVRPGSDGEKPLNAVRLYSELLRPALPALGGSHAAQGPGAAAPEAWSSVARNTAATQAAVSASAVARARLALSAAGAQVAARAGAAPAEDGRASATTGAPDAQAALVALAVAHAMRDRGADAASPPRGSAAPHEAGAPHPRAGEAAVAHHLAQGAVQEAARRTARPAAADPGQDRLLPGGRSSGAPLPSQGTASPQGLARAIAAAMTGRLGWLLAACGALLVLSMSFG